MENYFDSQLDHFSLIISPNFGQYGSLQGCPDLYLKTSKYDSGRLQQYMKNLRNLHKIYAFSSSSLPGSLPSKDPDSPVYLRLGKIQRFGISWAADPVHGPAARDYEVSIEVGPKW